MKLRDLPTLVTPYAAESDEHRRPPSERPGHAALRRHEHQTIQQSIDTSYEAFTPTKNCASHYLAESFS